MTWGFSEWPASEPRPQLFFSQTTRKHSELPDWNPMSFTNSLESFEAASAWLDETHEPEITALRFIADTLDNSAPANPAPLLSQWGLLLRSLRKEAPVASEDEDPLEKALRESKGTA